MPGLNGTGPMGQGPITGRGMGVCASCGAPVMRRRRFWTQQPQQTVAQSVAPQGIEDLKAIQEQLKQDLVDIEADIKKAQSEDK